MPSRPKTARAVADRMRRLADAAQTPDLRDAYLNLAAQWEQAADTAESEEEEEAKKAPNSIPDA